MDAVTITTPPETRRQLVLQALAAGAHVIADKPFAPTAEGGREGRASIVNQHDENVWSIGWKSARLRLWLIDRLLHRAPGNTGRWRWWER